MDEANSPYIIRGSPEYVLSLTVVSCNGYDAKKLSWVCLEMTENAAPVSTSIARGTLLTDKLTYKGGWELEVTLNKVYSSVFVCDFSSVTFSSVIVFISDGSWWFQCLWDGCDERWRGVYDEEVEYDFERSGDGMQMTMTDSMTCENEKQFVCVHVYHNKNKYCF